MFTCCEGICGPVLLYGLYCAKDWERRSYSLRMPPATSGANCELMP